MLKLSDVYIPGLPGQCGDKGTLHSYIEVYEELFASFQDKPINFLEIGVHYGLSIQMWEKYFFNGTVWGIDKNIVPGQYEFNNFIHGDCTDPSVYPQDVTYDIIIDDGSHLFEDQAAALEILWPKLNPGGMYIIEDVIDLDVFKEYDIEPYTYRNVHKFVGNKDLLVEMIRKYRIRNYLKDNNFNYEFIGRIHIKNRMDDLLLVLRK